MVEIFPETVRQGLGSQNREAQDIVTGIQSLRAAIRAYISETGLKGAAFAAHKAYMTEAHMGFLNMYARALSSMTTANERHIAAINTHLSTHSWFNSAQIEGEIACLTARIDDLDSLMSLLPEIDTGLRNTHDNLVNLRTNRQQKLQRLWDYISATNGIYIAPDRVLTEAALLLSRIEQTERCEITGMVTMPSMDDVKAAAAAAAMAELKNDVGYDWRTIREWLRSDPSDLTQAQLTALAQTFMGLTCLIDVERFINAGHISVRQGRGNQTFAQAPVFSTVSDTVQKLLRSRIADIEASDNPFSTRAEKLLFVKYYELQNDGNRRVMNGFLSPIRNAGLVEDVLEIKFISYRAPEPYKEIMFRLLPGIGIIDNKNAGAQHFSASENAIVVNFSNLRSGNDYLTFFHEIGHAVDFAMGRRNTYASESFFKVLEAEVFGYIEREVRANARCDTYMTPIMDALRYDGNNSELTETQREDYYEVRYVFRRILRGGITHQHRTASMIFGGFTENALIIDPDTGNRVGVGHERLGYYFNAETNEPTKAQTWEFFADHFSANVIGRIDIVDANREFFGNTTNEMYALLHNALLAGGG